MKLPLKFAAVTSSIALACGYIWFRSSNTLAANDPPAPARTEAKTVSPEAKTVSSSASATTQEVKRTFLPGSKNEAGIVDFSRGRSKEPQKPSAEPGVFQPRVPGQTDKRALLPGPKAPFPGFVSERPVIIRPRDSSPDATQSDTGNPFIKPPGGK